MIAEVTKGIHWVGCLDWNMRDFHSFETEHGVTYNAYLIQDEKNVLIDTVKAPFADELLSNIQEVIGLDKVDYVVCNHAEPDHTGALPKVMKSLPNATLLCNKKCKIVLAGYYNIENWKIEVIEEKKNIGSRTLQFINTPLVHWPESMYTYIPEDKILFSMDSFGQHLATSERFDDEVSESLLFMEAKKYYANILMPFSKQVEGALETAKKLDIEILAPSHGLIWRTKLDQILAKYDDWCRGRRTPRVLIIYDTMWESTEVLAKAILAGAASAGVNTQLLHLRRTSLTRVATEVLDAAAIAFGSSTLNKGMMPMAGAALTYMSGMMPRGKVGFSFGSSGWGKGGPEVINDYLKEMKWEIICDPIKSKYRPTEEVLQLCREAGRALAEKALEIAELTE